MAQFTFCSEFSPNQMSLKSVIEDIQNSQGYLPNLQEKLENKYFSGTSNKKSRKTLVYNAILSIEKYGLISREPGSKFGITELFIRLGEALKEADGEKKALDILARHIIIHLNGIDLLIAMESLEKNDETLTRENIERQLRTLGYTNVTGNAKGPGAMRQWLAAAEITDTEFGSINWDKIENLVGLTGDDFNNILDLPDDQVAFLSSLIFLCSGGDEWIDSNTVRKHCEETKGVKLTTKNLVSAVLHPLVQKSYIQTKKQESRGGQGGKPHKVKLLVSELQKEIFEVVLGRAAVVPIIDRSTKINSLSDALSKIDSKDIYEKGVALEQIAIWIARLIGLKSMNWRKRGKETGGAEVDLIAEGERPLPMVWQFQCKNQRDPVGVDVIAKEVGLTYLTHAQVIVVITTGTFTSDALQFAKKVNTNSILRVACLDGHDLSELKSDKLIIFDILNKKFKESDESDQSWVRLCEKIKRMNLELDGSSTQEELDNAEREISRVLAHSRTK